MREFRITKSVLSDAAISLLGLDASSKSETHSPPCSNMIEEIALCSSEENPSTLNLHPSKIFILYVSNSEINERAFKLAASQSLPTTGIPQSRPN